MKDQVAKFLTMEEVNQSLITEIKDKYPNKNYWEMLLILRGLFAYGIMLLTLNRRWRVNYGVGNNNNRLIAVPFRAKDVASDRAEFGHPDVAILYTQLSYYYSYLTIEQMDVVFEKLECMDSPIQEYSRWISEIPLELVPVSIRNYSGINLSDYSLKYNVLYPLLSKSMGVIDFYLNTVVFPKECKQFISKLTSSSWNLCKDKVNATTGFSGTKSFLLPTSIQENELEQLLDTSRNVEQHLLQNKDYKVLENGTTGINILKQVVACDPPQRIFLDVGALMLDLSNEQVAREWLNLLPISEVEAAIYFNKNDDLVVLDRHGHVTKLELSPYKTKLDKCVTYLY